MAPACSVPGFLGEEGGGGGGGGGGGRGDQNGVLNLETLRMQSSVSNAKGSVGKKAAVAMSNSMGSSSIAYEGPDIADDDGDEETNSPSPAAAAAAAEREIPKVLAVLASVLERLVARNEQFANSSSPSQQVVFNPKKLTIFHGLRAPGISIAKYLERIFKYTSCSPSCFVVGYVFIDRLIHRQPDLLVTSLNVHRLLVTSVMVATKMLDDV
jgi:hypothetical protein